jgi:hypothetical protein
MIKCWPCVRDTHAACDKLFFNDPCDCTHEFVPLSEPPSVIGNALGLTPQEPDSRATRRQKDDSAVTDPQSTGRKRAAALYPLKDENGVPIPCDLANKTSPTLPNYYKVQIDGCGVRKGSLKANAQSRHHWSYNTLDNERSNIGLLCHSCHNLIHSRNDPYKADIYETLYGFKPDTEDLRWANKALKSGVVGGGQIQSKSETLKKD